jgi:predicted DNA-binding transcriptional regulator YafY
LVARAGGKPRTYRVSNIHALDVTHDVFTRPARFNLAAYWDEWAAEFESRLYKDTATVRFSARGMQRLKLLAPAVMGMARRTARKPDKAGWARAEIPIESVQHAAGELLKLGADVEVLEPAALRDRMSAVSAEMAAIYGAARKPRTQKS